MPSYSWGRAIHVFVSHEVILPNCQPPHTSIDFAPGSVLTSSHCLSTSSTSVLEGYPGNWRQDIGTRIVTSEPMTSGTYMDPDRYRGVVPIEREVIPTKKPPDHVVAPIVDPFKLSVLRIKKLHSGVAACGEEDGRLPVPVRLDAPCVRELRYS